MSGKPEKEYIPDDGPYLGGLEDVTEEEIIRNIRDYPFVMGKLKDC